MTDQIPQMQLIDAKVEPEGFTEWLDDTQDSLPDVPSFSEWLQQNNDSI